MFTYVIQITSNEFSIHQMWRCGGNLQILLQFCNQWTVWNFFYIVKRSHGLISRQDFDRKRKHWMFTYVNSILCLLTLPASNNVVKYFLKLYSNASVFSKHKTIQKSLNNTVVTNESPLPTSFSTMTFKLLYFLNPIPTGLCHVITV